MEKHHVFVGDAHVDLKEIAKLESIDKLKELNIFQENADASNQAAWDAAQKFKEKEAEKTVKVEVTKAPKEPLVSEKVAAANKLTKETEVPSR